jgi:DNA-binding response OmpR family regulator
MNKPLAVLVEDDPKLGIIYETALKQAGFDTFLDIDGNQVMDYLPTVEPALIILDAHLPYASGTDLLRRIRADERWARVPVIVATADLYIAKSLEGQAEYVLLKPVGLSRLMDIVNRLRPTGPLKSVAPNAHE